MPNKKRIQEDPSLTPAIKFTKMPPVFVTGSITEPLPLTVALQALKHCAAEENTVTELEVLADLIVLMKRGEQDAAHLRLAEYFEAHRV